MKKFPLHLITDKENYLSDKKKIVAMVSPTCKYCKKAAKRNEYYQKAQPYNSISIIMTGHRDHLQAFLDETRADNIPLIFMDSIPQFQKLNGRNGVPTIKWIEDSTVGQYLYLLLTKRKRNTGLAERIISAKPISSLHPLLYHISLVLYFRLPFVFKIRYKLYFPKVFLHFCLMKLKLERPIACVDLETTGISITKDRIVEIAIIKVMPDGERITKVMRTNPEMPIPAVTTAIHGIADADVADKPTFKEVGNEIKQFIDNCDLCGFNSTRFRFCATYRRILTCRVLILT